MESFTNQTFDEIKAGEAFELSHVVTADEIELLSLVSGDANAFKADLPEGSCSRQSSESVSAEALLHGILKRRLPGPGTVIVSHSLTYSGVVCVGDELIASVKAVEKRAPNIVAFDCTVRRGADELVKGLITVAAPTKKQTADHNATPSVILRRNDVFARLFEKCKASPAVTCAVVHPCDRDSLAGPIEAAKLGLIVPILVGPEAKIRAVAQAEGIDLTGIRIVSTEHSQEAAVQAVAMARSGEVQSLMKGSLHTDELMAAVVPSATGLRTARRISHVFIMDVPAYPRMLLVTDAAVNIAPTIKDKVDIAQNAINLAIVLGVAEPRVAVLAAVETVNPDMQATIDAAMLCKMAERGQITGGLIDGPLAFDNAISEEAARTKKIVSQVAGKADILLVPDLEAGNMVAKQLQYLAGADSAGIVLGTRVPIVLTSRADSVRTRLASTAVLKLLAEANQTATKKS